MDFLSYTEEEVILFSNQETDIETHTFEEAVYYLSKEKIPVPGDRFKKKISVRYRSSEGIYDEYVDEPFFEGLINVWEYGNGAFASMLSLN